MKLLRDQIKNMEKYYIKPTRRSSEKKDKKFNYMYGNKNDTYNSFNNSNMFNQNLHGSYNNNSHNNNFNQKNNTAGSGSFQNYMLRDNINDPFFEEFTNIKMLWDDLGVTDNYRVIFENLSKDIDPLMKQDLFEHENNSLGKFSELLIVIK